MQNKNNYCVIMAGGIGSRFWPISRTNKPKQFLDILNVGKTLLQQTFERFEYFCPPGNIYIVTGAQYEQLTKEQLPFIDEKQILLEPFRRNTAPCIAYAVAKIETLNPEANIIVTPSDHLILNEDVFRNVIQTGLNFTATHDALITIGLRPTRPETGYGYIQYEQGSGSDSGVYPVKTFTEKPNLDLAKIFLESGDFLWNSGIFIWNLKSINKALKKFAPDIYYNFADLATVYNSPNEKLAIQETYLKCKSISIDYAVMEKADNVFVVEGNFSWSDLGTWGSLFDYSVKDDRNNAINSQNVLSFDVQNTIVRIPSDKIAVIQGLEDFIVAEDAKYLLICKKSEEQRIRDFVTELEKKFGSEEV